MITALTSWWDGREPRERFLLMGLGLILMVFLLVFALILPVQSVRDSAQTDLDRAKSELAIVSRIAPTLGAAGTGARAPFDRSVLINVSGTHGVKLTRVQPGDDGSFAVWIDDAQTASLYGVFDDLLSNYAVTMDRAVVSADANGRLSAQFTVR